MFNVYMQPYGYDRHLMGDGNSVVAHEYLELELNILHTTRGVPPSMDFYI